MRIEACRVKVTRCVRVVWQASKVDSRLWDPDIVQHRLCLPRGKAGKDTPDNFTGNEGQTFNPPIEPKRCTLCTLAGSLNRKIMQNSFCVRSNEAMSGNSLSLLPDQKKEPIFERPPNCTEFNYQLLAKLPKTIGCMTSQRLQAESTQKVSNPPAPACASASADTSSLTTLQRSHIHCFGPVNGEKAKLSMWTCAKCACFDSERSVYNLYMVKCLTWPQVTAILRLKLSSMLSWMKRAEV